MKKFLNVLKYIAFFAVGVVMFYFVYRDLGVEKVFSEVKDLKWGWIWISFVLGLLSHLSRAVRWNMLITPLGYKPRTINTFFSVMIMYATNLAIPRGGELARCTVLSKSEKIPFTKLVGTVFVERATDTVILAILVLFTVFSQIGTFKTFIGNNPNIADKLEILMSPLFWIVGVVAVVGVIVLIWKFKNKLKEIKLFAKVYDLMSNFWQGIKSIKDLKHPGRYIAHSIFIFVMYFLMTYVVFFSYEPTSGLSPLIGLTAFIMGGLAMLAPVQGGIGAWHFMIIETLFLFGLDRADGKIYAFVCHTSMNLMLIVVGVLCVILLPIVNRGRKDLKNNSEEQGGESIIGDTKNIEEALTI